ncbi:MAG: TonB family protein [Nitrospira sp.]|nr:TonB family protein [Candidatus Manganitrophaceae bacterium]HIL34241.1 TonB family protein [Candidatus Manganitrophaceae bacterium]
MQISSLRTGPSSFPYLPCLLLSFAFHLSLFLGFQRLDLMTSSAKDRQEETISFVDLESVPSFPRKDEQKEEDIPDIVPETPPKEAQKLSSILPSDLSASNAPDLAKSPVPLSKPSVALPSLPKSEPPQVSAEAPISVPEPTPVSTKALPEETIQEGTDLEDAARPSEAAEPISEPGPAPPQSDLAQTSSSDPAEEVGEPEGDAGEKGNPDGTPPLSSTLTASVRKEGFSRKKQTKKQVQKVGLLGLLGKKTPGRGPSIRKLRQPLSIRKNALHGKDAKGSSTEQETNLPFKNKGDKIDTLRRKVLQEEQSRLTRRSGSPSAQTSDLRIIQGSDRNYGIISSSVQIKRSRLTIVYNNQLRNSPNLEGNVILEFVVSPDGGVLKCNILTSSLGNPEFEKALVREILQWRFPRVKKGTTTILFPILFFPSG